MQRILTPSGYRDITDCAVGDEVSAFDIETGAPLVNTIEGVRWIDAETFRDWQNPTFLINGVEHLGLHSLYVLCPPKNAPQPVKVRDLTVGNEVFRIDATGYVFDYEIASIVQVDPYPSFIFFRINGTWTLNSEQSIWRNGGNVCHAKHLVVGDVIYDDADQDVTITSIEEVTLDGWWRFDVSGDHSYIVDGITVHNASRFWVGGTASWTAVNTTPWAATSGGAGGQTVPGSADTVTFNGSSGGGTVTLNFGGAITLQSLNIGSFTGTWDNSANNNNVTLTAASTASFDNNGSGTRTINLGSATYTLSGVAASFSSGASGLTLNATSSTIAFTGTTGNRIFSGGPKAYGTVTFAATSSGSGGAITQVSSGSIASLVLTAPIYATFQSGTSTITSLTAIGSSSSQIFLASDSNSSTVAVTSATLEWTAVRSLTFTGSPTATNSFSGGNNSGITITAPSAGGGGGGSFSATIF